MGACNTEATSIKLYIISNFQNTKTEVVEQKHYTSSKLSSLEVEDLDEHKSHVKVQESIHIR